MAHTKVTLKGAVQRMDAGTKQFLDTAGNETGRSKQLSITLPDGFRMRIVEGDPLFEGFCKFVRVGTILELDVRLKPDIFNRPVTTDSGAEGFVAQVMLNCEDVELISITAQELPDVFKGMAPDAAASAALDFPLQPVNTKRAPQGAARAAATAAGMNLAALTPVVGGAAPPPDADMPG